MILSERELELGSDHTGIMVLEEGIEPGTPLADALPIADVVLDLEITGNRPDLLAVYGVAREVATLLRTWSSRRRPAAIPSPPARSKWTWRSRTTRAARATSAALPGRPIGPSPHWLQARLTASGMRPISNVVDVTNYVMHGLGNPLHAFDHATLAGPRIVVRRARPDEGCGRSTASCASSSRRPDDRRRRALGRAGRDHGRRGDRGHGCDDRGAARGGELRAVRVSGGRPSACACVPRARTAGRRVSIRT